MLWPGREDPTPLCGKCATKARAVARVLGFTIPIRGLPLEPNDHDDDHA